MSQDDINSPHRKQDRVALASILHKAIDEYARSRGGLSYVDTTIVLADLSGAVAAKTGLAIEDVCERVIRSYDTSLSNAAVQEMLQRAEKEAGNQGLTIPTTKKE